MARGVDQVEHVVLAVRGAVVHADRLQLDGDAALALQVHRVEDLVVHLALRVTAPVSFEQPVGQGGFAVVDVGDDAEVADSCGIQRMASLKNASMVR